MACRLLLPAFVTILIIVGASTPTWAADLGIQVNPDRESSRFYVTYQKTVLIEYPEGGLIRDQLNGLDWQVAGSADSSNPGVQESDGSDEPEHTRFREPGIDIGS